MSVQLRDIKHRIGSTRQIHKMTATMQKVAAARLVRDRSAAEGSRLYTDRLRQVMREVSGEAREMQHPLLDREKSGAACLVVFGSDRGLCGGYNAVLVREMQRFARESAPEPAGFITVGRIVSRRGRFSGLDIRDQMEQPRAGERAELLDAMAAKVIDEFVSGRVAGVSVLYWEFASVLHQDLKAEQILPAPFVPGGDEAGGWGVFEPEPEEVLARLLPEYVRQMLDYAFLSGLASEDASRQTAMTRASENARNLLEELGRQYSRLRQENVTTEVLEVAASSLR
ncbi:ATP synthase F1 subunit gamma [Verrucomicrobiota bacterium]